MNTRARFTWYHLVLVAIASFLGAGLAIKSAERDLKTTIEKTCATATMLEHRAMRDAIQKACSTPLEQFLRKGDIEDD